MTSELATLMGEMGTGPRSGRLAHQLQSGQGAHTPMGAAMASQIGGAVRTSLQACLKTGGIKGNSLRVRQLLEEATPDLCAAVATTRVFTALFSFQEGKESTLGSLRVAVGSAIKDEVEFRLAVEGNKTKYRYTRALMDGGGKRASRARNNFLRTVGSEFKTDWDRRDCYILGSLVLDHFLAHSEIVETVQVWKHPGDDLRRQAKPTVNVRLTKPAMDAVFAAADRVAASTVVYLPMEEPPEDWSPTSTGGYRAVYPGLDHSLMRSNKKEQREAFEESNCPEVYQAINTLQRTAWRINKPVLEMVRLVKDRRWPELQLVTDPLPFPERPLHEWTKGDPAWMDFRRDKFEALRSDEEYRKDVMDVARTISVGDILLTHERFYFPHFLDFRGRAYPTCARLSYQGADYQRGSLEFADGKPIDSPEALEWLQVHGANCFGQDKIPTAERVAWVNENEARIRHCAKDPIDNRWWTEADKPFCFLAFCLDYAGFLESPSTHLSYLPVAMDGSNNGLQVYSLLLRDEVGGLATNCTPSYKVHDIYQEVADVATLKLQKISRGNDPKKSRSAREFLKFCEDQGLDGLPRKAVKRPVMTLPYGATRYSCQRYLAEWYHGYVRGLSLHGDALPFRDGDSYQVLYFIGTVVWDAISDVVVKAREAMAWLHDCAAKTVKEGTHLKWTSPLGMVCLQRYVRGKTKRTKLYSQGRWLKLQYWLDDGDVKSRKSVSGFCPNYVHSLDASVMMRTTNWASESGVTHFQMVHDSFGTHAADAPTLARSLREAAVSLFQTDQLDKLRTEIQRQLPQDVTLDESPLYGGLDIEALLDAEYFFK